MKKKIFYMLITMVLLATAQYFFLRGYYINNELLNNLITFLSIIFGFYITSLAIFSTSKYVSSLYKVLDANDKRLTLLNTLMKNYKTGLIIILISTIYLLILQFVLTQQTENKMFLSNYFSLPFLAVLGLNFYYSYKMLDDLIKIIIQEAKNN